MAEENVVRLNPTLTRLTHSGDFYTALESDWILYWEAVRRDDWNTVMFFEEGGASFKYTP